MARYFEFENLGVEAQKVADDDVMAMMLVDKKDEEIYVKDDDGDLVNLNDCYHDDIKIDGNDLGRLLDEHHGIYLDEDGSVQVRDFDYGLTEIADAAYDKDGNKIAYDESKGTEIFPVWNDTEEAYSYYSTADDFVAEIADDDYEDIVNAYDPARIAPIVLYGMADVVANSDYDSRGQRIERARNIGDTYLLVTGGSSSGDYQIEIKQIIDSSTVTTVDAWISRYDNDNPEKVIQEFCERNGYKYTCTEGEEDLGPRLTPSERFAQKCSASEETTVKQNGRRLQ